MTQPTRAIPVLPVADVVRAVAWYGRLGFVARATFADYAVVAFDGAEVHLRGEANPVPPTETVTGAYLRVGDVDAVFAHWTAMGARAITRPADQPHGLREFATEDPDGNLWRVGTPLSVPPPDTPVLGAEESAFAPHSAKNGSGGDELPARALGAQVRDEVHAFGELLADADDEQVRARPKPEAWSALERGVHVRDLLAVQAERVVRTLAEPGPELARWDPEAAIVDGMANEADVAAVVADLGRNAAKLSEALRMVDDEAWARTATCEGRPLTIEAMAREALDETLRQRDQAAAALGPTA